MKLHKFPVTIQGGCFILLALMLLMLPLTWVAAAIFAALIHECFHIGAAILLSGKIYRIQIGANGAKMELQTLPPGKELIVAAAGPVGSALMVLLTRWMPRTAICAFVHCIYNLLPLFPFDGGRILSCICICLFSEEKGGRVFLLLQKICRILLLSLCIPVAMQWGILPASAIAIALVRKRSMRPV